MVAEKEKEVYKNCKDRVEGMVFKSEGKKTSVSMDHIYGKNQRTWLCVVNARIFLANQKIHFGG